MKQFLSKEWNVSMSPTTDVFKVYDPMFSKVLNIYRSKAKLHLENSKMPINLFHKIIINDEYEIDIIKKDDILSFYYPSINEIIPINNKDKVEIPLFELGIDTIMKVELVTLNKVKNICYLFCPFYLNDDVSTFKSTFVIVNQKDPMFILKERIALKTFLMSNNKIKEIKNMEEISSVIIDEIKKSKFNMLTLTHSKSKYTEHHIIKSLVEDKYNVFSEELSNLV